MPYNEEKQLFFFTFDFLITDKFSENHCFQ